MPFNLKDGVARIGSGVVGSPIGGFFKSPLTAALVIAAIIVLYIYWFVPLCIKNNPDAGSNGKSLGSELIKIFIICVILSAVGMSVHYYAQKDILTKRIGGSAVEESTSSTFGYMADPSNTIQPDDTAFGAQETSVKHGPPIIGAAPTSAQAPAWGSAIADHANKITGSGTAGSSRPERSSARKPMNLGLNVISF